LDTGAFEHSALKKSGDESDAPSRDVIRVTVGYVTLKRELRESRTKDFHNFFAEAKSAFTFA
jgi:hypothetical protein